MAQIIPPKVNPGDLITATYIDMFVDAISGLDQRLSKLEAVGSVTSPVTISGYTATQPVHVGDPIEIDGSGFLVPAVLNQVSMGGQQVTDLSSNLNSPTKLFFPVPSIPGATDAGIPVTVTVTNANGSATSTFQILVRSAVVAPSGRVQLAFATPPVMPVSQPNITAGQPYTFGFGLTVITDKDGTYAFTPSISGAGWAAALVDPSPVKISAGGSTTMRVQVTAAAGAGLLTLSVVETTPGTRVIPGSAQITITTGNPPPTPETRVRVTLAGASLGAAISGTAVNFTKNQQGAVTFTIVLTEAGDYTVSAAMRVSTGWTPGGIDIPSFHVNAPPPGTTANQTVNVLFTSGSGATNTDLIFTVNRPADNLSVSYAQSVTTT